MFVSLVFILLTRLGIIDSARFRSLDILKPLIIMVNAPAHYYEGIKLSLVSRHQLIEENTKLKANLTILSARLQSYVLKTKENQELRELLSSSAQLKGSFISADLLAVPNSGNYQEIIINRGSNSGVYLGQPVLNSQGILGHVSGIGKTASKVTLLTDSTVAIPVETVDGLRAIAVGLGHKRLMVVNNVQDSMVFHVGQKLFASGLGLVYPHGYPVGEVVYIKKNIGEGFATIGVKPAADLDRLRLMLLIWPEHQLKIIEEMRNI